MFFHASDRNRFVRTYESLNPTLCTNSSAEPPAAGYAQSLVPLFRLSTRPPHTVDDLTAPTDRRGTPRLRSAHGACPAPLARSLCSPAGGARACGRCSACGSDQGYPVVTPTCKWVLEKIRTWLSSFHELAIQLQILACCVVHVSLAFDDREGIALQDSLES